MNGQTATLYLPDRGDLIWTRLDPTKGRVEAARLVQAKLNLFITI